MSPITRRDFIQKTTAVAAGCTLPLNVQTGKNSTDDKPKIKRYKPFGKTGFMVGDISCGAGQRDPGLLKHIFDCGINYIDTAYIYGRGKSENDIGLALKGRREGIWINTKFNDPAFKAANIEKALMASLDESLRRMKIDYVDSIMIHDAKPSEIQCDELHSMFSKAKQAGKVKYLGISSHSSEAAKIFKQTLDCIF